MSHALRQPQVVDLRATALPLRRSNARGQNFIVERLAGGGNLPFALSSASEIIVLLPDTGAGVAGTHEGDLPGTAVVILPAGSYQLTPSGAGDLYVLATDRTDEEAGAAANAGMYAEADARVRPIGERYRRVAHNGEIRIYPVAEIAIPPDNGRLRFLQSETMSINWVEYEGVRDRSALSPHAHADAEQASLAIEGHFIHHLRTPWGRDADQWREDQHLVAGPGTIAIIPPEIIHTTEGSGDGRHVLIDVFAPPRADFIARSWVFNSSEYAAPADA